MTEWEALMRAVCANPDDDLPRLVLADWLDENGEPERAEFIRVQCRLSSLLLTTPERLTLERRVEKLLRGHDRRWSQELPTAPGFHWSGGYDRGFQMTLTINQGHKFLEYLHACFTSAPLAVLSVHCA